MIIRDATLVEAPLLTELTLLSKDYWGYGPAQMAKWKEELTITPDYIDKNRVMVLEIEGPGIIGYYSVLQQSNTKWLLDNLFVLPQYIGQGYGRSLLEDCIATAKSSLVQKLTLESEPQAEAFYKQFGFKTISSSPSSIPDRHLPIMELSLT